MNTTSSSVETTPFDDGALYDLFLGNFPVGFEFYTGLAKTARGPVLETSPTLSSTSRLTVCCTSTRLLLLWNR